MDSTSSGKLKQDVWRYIFEVIVDEAESSDVVLPLLLVCKEWKVIALPLLYRYLHFYQPTSIIECQPTLVRHGIRGAYPGNSTRSIELNVDTSWPGTIAPRLGKLLRYTPLLKRFHSPMFGVGTDILDILGQSCGSSLKQLDIAIGGKNTDVTLQVALVTRFTSLRTLGIHLLNMVQSHSIDTPAFDMPSLRRLSLRCSNEQPSEFIHFFCGGSFVALDYLSLHIRYFSGQHLEHTTRPAVLRLLEKLGHQLSILELHIPQAEDVARLLFPLLKAVRYMELLNTLPNDIGRFLPASVNELKLYINMQDAPHMQALLQCLDNLRDTKQKTHALEVVYLQSWAASEPFHWSTISTLNPALAGHLMTMSIGLQLKDIKLLDNDGKCVMLG
ncbi:hypothetical protein CALVIDRAFT_136364 [Calocera viscosa TUFC12733]|uniref:F-box domain-containing protein n=1 Tax=Calocera viscosa (strain TUFC12733) TaxID=1330018 RepID=A0A167LYA0_CALVF|nr:hypothetical protein CALVIDRAFT_136364 [Calocera viscosa TUFC12733]